MSQKSQKMVPKGPEPPKPICLTKHKLEGVDLRRKMQGLRNYHLLYGPSWRPKKREQCQGVGWVNSKVVG